MFYSIKKREGSEFLKKLVTLTNQLDELRLQDKLEKQNFHENTKNYMSHLLIQLKIPLEIYQKLQLKILTKTTTH